VQAKHANMVSPRCIGITPCVDQSVKLSCELCAKSQVQGRMEEALRRFEELQQRITDAQAQLQAFTSLCQEAEQAVSKSACLPSGHQSCEASLLDQPASVHTNPRDNASHFIGPPRAAMTSYPEGQCVWRGVGPTSQVIILNEPLYVKNTLHNIISACRNLQKYSCKGCAISHPIFCLSAMQEWPDPTRFLTVSIEAVRLDPAIKLDREQQLFILYSFLPEVCPPHIQCTPCVLPTSLHLLNHTMVSKKFL